MSAQRERTEEHGFCVLCGNEYHYFYYPGDEHVYKCIDCLLKAIKEIMDERIRMAAKESSK